MMVNSKTPDFFQHVFSISHLYDGKLSSKWKSILSNSISHLYDGKQELVSLFCFTISISHLYDGKQTCLMNS